MVSRLVAHINQHEWLVRERSEEDKRVLLLALTPERRRIATELAEAWRARFII